MRYIKYRTFVTKTTDEDVGDLQSVRAILDVIKSKELDCGMQLNEGPRMALVRILDIRENDFTFLTVKNHSSLKRNALLSDIAQLEVYDINEDTVQTKPNISRWIMLEPVDFFDEPGDSHV